MTPDQEAARLLRRHRAVVFDLDGTLVDTLPDLTDALNLALADLGLAPVDAQLVQQSLHGGLEGSAAAAMDEHRADNRVREALLDRYRQHYAASLCRRSQVYEGCEALLRLLQARGAVLGVCTNKPWAMAVELLDALNLRRWFQVVVGADTCGLRKPHPAPLRHAVAALGHPLDQALLVGDSDVDRACAAAAPTACLSFLGGYGAPPRGAVAGHHAHFERYANLQQALLACDPVETWS